MTALKSTEKFEHTVDDHKITFIAHPDESMTVTATIADIDGEIRYERKFTLEYLKSECACMDISVSYLRTILMQKKPEITDASKSFVVHFNFVLIDSAYHIGLELDRIRTKADVCAETAAILIDIARGDPSMNLLPEIITQSAHHVAGLFYASLHDLNALRKKFEWFVQHDCAMLNDLPGIDNYNYNAKQREQIKICAAAYHDSQEKKCPTPVPQQSPEQKITPERVTTLINLIDIKWDVPHLVVIASALGIPHRKISKTRLITALVDKLGEDVLTLKVNVSVKA